MKKSLFLFAPIFAIKSIMFAALFFNLNGAARAAGVLDATFGANGRVAVEVGAQTFAFKTIVQPDGKIIVLGRAVRAAQEDVVLIRFNPNGALDASFGDGGKVFAAISPLFDTPGDFALAPDGKIIVVGSTRTPGSATGFDFFVARFNANGGFDASFGNNGTTIINQTDSDGFGAVALQPDGKIVAAGSVSNRAAVARFNPNGSLDAAFNGGFVLLDLPDFTGEYFSEIALLANGRILVGGLARYAPAFPVAFNNTDILVLLESSGATVQEFGRQGLATGGSAHFTSGFDLAVLPDGKILTTGAATNRFTSDGIVDQTFSRSGTGSSIAVRADGKFVKINRSPPSPLNYLSLHTNDGRLIGQALNFGGNEVAVQPDNKILLVSSTPTEFVVTRLAAITSQATRLADYDGDERTDLAFSRLSNSALYVSRSSNGGEIIYNSGEASFGVRRVIPERFSFQSQFVYWRSSGNIIGSSAAFCSVSSTTRQCTQWGMLGDVPVGGDYDGDGFSDYTVFRPSEGIWYIRQSSGNNPFRAVQFGQAGDRPVPADYDYDGITDIAVYRPSNGVWYVRRSSDEMFYAVQFGAAADVPLTGDYDGDGRADFVVYRPSSGIWYQLTTTEGFKAAQFGISTDAPVPGDYDGDGKHDLAVFRGGVWYLLQSRDGFKAVQFGAENDAPASVRYDQ